MMYRRRKPKLWLGSVLLANSSIFLETLKTVRILKGVITTSDSSKILLLTCWRWISRCRVDKRKRKAKGERKEQQNRCQ
jgi:hypothetical protein